MDEKENTFITENINLVRHIIKKFKTSRDFDYDDLLQEGCIALLKAYRTYDPSKKVKLSTYAGTCIHNQIKMLLRKFDNNNNRLYVKSHSMEISPTENHDNSFHDILPSTIGVAEEVIKRDLISYLVAYKHDETVKTFQLYHFGYSEKEIVDITNYSQSCVNRRIKRIRNRANNYMLS